MDQQTRLILTVLGAELTDYQLSDVTQSQGENIANILLQLDSYAGYKFVVISEIVEMRKDTNSAFLLLLSINSTYKIGKIPIEHTITEFEIIGIVNLKRDYGQVLIRPETLGDKISEFFGRVEVDFSMDEEFSRKYYVLTNDETHLRTVITAEFLRIMRNYDGLEVEISGQKLVARLRKPFTVENGRIIAGFVGDVCNGII